MTFFSLGWKNYLNFEAMIQTLIIVALFIFSLAYVGRMVYRNFTRKDGCASGCGKCGVDFTAIEQQLQKK